MQLSCQEASSQNWSDWDFGLALFGLIRSRLFRGWAWFRIDTWHHTIDGSFFFTYYTWDHVNLALYLTLILMMLKWKDPFRTVNDRVMIKLHSRCTVWHKKMLWSHFYAKPCTVIVAWSLPDHQLPGEDPCLCLKCYYCSKYINDIWNIFVGYFSLSLPLFFIFVLDFLFCIFFFFFNYCIFFICFHGFFC